MRKAEYGRLTITESGGRLTAEWRKDDKVDNKERNDNEEDFGKRRMLRVSG